MFELKPVLHICQQSSFIGWHLPVYRWGSWDSGDHVAWIRTRVSDRKPWAVCIRSPCRHRVAVRASWSVGRHESSSPVIFFPVNAHLVCFFAQLSLKTVTWCGSRAFGRRPSPATWPPSTSKKEASWPWQGPRPPWMGLRVSLHFPVCEMGMLILACWGCWTLPWDEDN